MRAQTQKAFKRRTGKCRENIAAQIRGMQGPRLGGSVVAEVLLAKDCKSRKMRTSAATNKATAEMRMKTAKSDHDTCQRRNKLKVKHEGSVCALCQALLGRSKTSRHVYGDDPPVNEVLFR